MAHGCDDLVWIVEHRDEHCAGGRMHSHVLHRAVTAYQKNYIEPVRIDVFDAHGRRQRGTQLLHIALLLLDFVRVVAVVSKVEAQGVNGRG